MARDYIPREDAKLDEWLENFKNQLPAIAALLGIPLPLITAVTTAYGNWDLAFDAHRDAHNAAQSAAQTKDEARSAAKDAVRPVVGMIQKHPSATDTQRETLKITVWDAEPTPTSPDYVVNLAPPLLLLDWSKRSVVTVHFGVNPSNEKQNGKPADIAGVRIYYRIETGPWNFVADDTNSPYNHNFAITEPQNVEYRAQWFDKNMRLGVFGESAKCLVTP